MSIPLERLIEGIIATLRSDVIPHVNDPYARGQTIGVIDLLNNLGPRIEWRQASLRSTIAAKQQVLAEAAALTGGSIPQFPISEAASAEALLEQRAELDARIGDVVAALWPRRDDPACAAALAAMRAHLRTEMTEVMKSTRKPLFAEIASGGSKAG